MRLQPHRVSLPATALPSQPVYSDKADNRAGRGLSE
jgi:hypothetical protein